MVSELLLSCPYTLPRAARVSFTCILIRHYICRIWNLTRHRHNVPREVSPRLLHSSPSPICWGWALPSRMLKANASTYKQIPHLITYKIPYRIHCSIPFHIIAGFTYHCVLKFSPSQHIEIFLVHLHSCTSGHCSRNQVPFAEHHSWVRLLLLQTMQQ